MDYVSLHSSGELTKDHGLFILQVIFHANHSSFNWSSINWILLLNHSSLFGRLMLQPMQVFVWLVVHKQLWNAPGKKALYMFFSAVCLLCKNEEFVDHIFLHCTFATQILICLLQVFGLERVYPRSSILLLSGEFLTVGANKKCATNLTNPISTIPQT